MVWRTRRSDWPVLFLYNFPVLAVVSVMLVRTREVVVKSMKADERDEKGREEKGFISVLRYPST